MKATKLRSTLARSASWLVFSTVFGSATIAHAQDTVQNEQNQPSDADAAADDTIVVTGIRASLDRSIELKRNNAGVVDGISAEEIGKFPDTNLALSLIHI